MAGEEVYQVYGNPHTEARPQNLIFALEILAKIVFTGLEEVLRTRCQTSNILNMTTIQWDSKQDRDDQNDDTFEYNAEYEVLFCTLHYTAVRGLIVHLRDSHNLGKERRKPVLAKYRHFLLRHSKDVELPKLEGPPFAALGKPLNGFQCDDCGQLNSEHWTKVKVQTFFGVGFQRYFIVECQEKTSSQAEAEDDDNNEDAAVRDQLLREFNEIDERNTKRFEIADSKTEKSDNTG
ncbi:hypothetical protein BDZ45DRAFT_756095 [Acephala macrosclerotiorum]|nr:hypothetical protein BDZ45DRAFT_756095 [Acephala macrosclerotiorum]